tara:strand:+ start:16984 stop:17598 length:615 start_codon:yes stop_codon:yes gene_type:complete
MLFGATQSFNNYLHFFSLISPYLLAYFMVMLSLFNQDIKGLIYLAGVLIASCINIVLMNLFKISTPQEATSLCKVFSNSVENGYSVPYPSSVFIAFTLAYIVLPMTFNNNMNYLVLFSLFAIYFLDSYSKITNYCTPTKGVALGGLIGFILGSLWYTCFYVTGYKSLLYFDTYSSNRVFCSKPSKQQFKCTVYKNGQAISSNIA